MSQQDTSNSDSGTRGTTSVARRWALSLSLIFFVLILGMAILAGWAYKNWTSETEVPPGTKVDVEVRIPKGMTLIAAADTLAANKLLNNTQVFLLGARLTGQDRGLRAGLYALKRGTAPRDLLADLTSGKSVQVKLTIVEGLNADEIAAVVAESMGFEPSLFLAIADSLAQLAIKEQGYMGTDAIFASFDSLVTDKSAWVNREPHWCEGYLAPDTYLFAEGSKPVLVANHLINAQIRKLEQAKSLATGKLAQFISAHELLTLASIVEAEARRDDERAKISAVYTNRLLQRWRLQADPTVAFFLNKKGKRIYFKDLRIASPFNTYENYGLPPAPIGAAGLLSLMAAASPDAECKAMFFVSDGFDGHVFSRTAQEHEKAVLRFRRFRNGMQH